MIYVGIDFSINSPSITIRDDEKYEFISFFNFDGKTWDSKPTKRFNIHNELKELSLVHMFPYQRIVKSKTFTDREREKLIDAKSISILITSTLKEFIGDKDYLIGIEGFSYASKGNSFIDLIQYNTFLKVELIQKFNLDKIKVFQPSQVKKLSGKGNANKNFMLKAFKENFLSDSLLSESRFWKWCKNINDIEDIPKPVDDLVDSYFICNLLV